MNFNQWIRIEVPNQKLCVLTEDGVFWQTEVSTSVLGLGEVEGSYKTPRGMHRIAEKIGQGAPLFSVFKSRQLTGEIFTTPSEDDLILTRILWLDGVESGNLNTYSRYIYIHGTNHEDKIGTPSSKGCVRMRNVDVAKLFDLVEVGTPVEIVG